MRVCEIVFLQTLLIQSNKQTAVISSQEFAVDMTVYVGLLARDVCLAHALRSKCQAIDKVN